MLWRAVEENCSPSARADAEVRYVSGERRVCVLEALSPPPFEVSEDAMPWKAGGVYVVTGGGGGLGLLLAEEITRRAAVPEWCCWAAARWVSRAANGWRRGVVKAA